MLEHILVMSAAFLGIWLGSGVVIQSVSKLASEFKVSTFAFSFFVLGFLTSIPEISIGLNAIIKGEPEIFVGNLLGGIAVLLLLIVPLLAITGKKVNLNHNLRKRDFLATLGIIAAPTLLVLDRRVSNEEAVLLVILFLSLFYILPSRPVRIRNIRSMFGVVGQKFVAADAIRLLAGVAMVYGASNVIVNSTSYFSDVLAVSPFVFSLIGLAIGTNLPELVLGVRAVATGNKDVALGDYMGSAAYNCLLFGVLSLINNGEVLTQTSFVPTFISINLGLAGFFWLTAKDNTLSRREGFYLLSLYLVFVAAEISAG